MGEFLQCTLALNGNGTGYGQIKSARRRGTQASETSVRRSCETTLARRPATWSSARGRNSMR